MTVVSASIASIAQARAGSALALTAASVSEASSVMYSVTAAAAISCIWSKTDIWFVPFFLL